jgi:hypothetical protein
MTATAISSRPRLGAAILVLLALVLLAALWWAPAGAGAATRLTGSGRVQDRPAAASAEEAGGAGGPRAFAVRVRNPAAYAQAKREAAAAARPGRRALAAVGGRTAVFGGLNAPGVSAAQAIAGFGERDDVTPPDTTGEIGPSAFVEITNGLVAVYSRANLALIGSPLDLATFVQDAGGAPCDPQVKFDPQTDRWFYEAIGCGSSDLGELFVGWSITPDPSNLTTGWCKFAGSGSVESSAAIDYPKLALDANHIIIGANVFNAINGSFLTAEIAVAAKPPAGALSACTPPTFTFFGSSLNPLTTQAGDLAFSPEPASVSGGAATGYVVAADFNDHASPPDSSGDNLMVWQVGGSAGTPTVNADGDIAVPGFSVPPPVPQPGTSDPIDSLDGRLTQAVAAPDPKAGGAETVWTQHTIAGDGGSVVRWYELLPATMTVRQTGTVADPAGYAFNGAIAPTLNGGAVIDYNAAGPAQLVQIKAQARAPNAPLGIMGGTLTLAASSAVDSDFSCPSQPAGQSEGSVACRWGDYAGASVDPSNPNLVWGASQVDGPTGVFTPGFGDDAQWATQIFAIAPDLPPTASFVVSPNPGTAGSPITFNAGGSSDPDGTIAGYLWSFGDGHSATGAAPAHTYNAPGTYTVTLTVIDNGGELATASQAVTVKPKPLSVRLSIPRGQTLGAALAHGLVLIVSSNQAAGAAFRLTTRVRRGGRWRALTLLVTTPRRLGAGRHRIRLRLPAAAARGLRAERAVTVYVRVSLTDAFGQRRTVTGRATLR